MINIFCNLIVEFKKDQEYNFEGAQQFLYKSLNVSNYFKALSRITAFTAINCVNDWMTGRIAKCLLVIIDTLN